MVKKVSGVFFLSSFPRADFTFEMILKIGFEKLYLLNFFCGMKITASIKTPIKMESCC